MKKYQIHLTPEERAELAIFIAQKNIAAAKRTRAQILVAADASGPDKGRSDETIAAVLKVSVSTVERTRCVLCEHGLQVALHGWPSLRNTPRSPFDAKTEAHLVASACGDPPEGRAHWTLSLLAERMVQLKIVESISPSTVGRILQKNELKPWRVESWCFPAKENAAFVCAMEDTLGVYARPRDPSRPLVCLDEFSKQLIGQVTPPQPCLPGLAARQDYEYERFGVCSGFMLYSPLEHSRQVVLTGTRTAKDYAAVIKHLCDDLYPEAEKIILVQDNLNTHSPASLYEAYPPEEALRLRERIEWHYTPKHGSWLNMAEIEIGVLGGQCLDRRIATKVELETEAKAWASDRNSRQCGTDWRFTTEDARVKLRKLYPSSLLI